MEPKLKMLNFRAFRARIDYLSDYIFVTAEFFLAHLEKADYKHETKPEIIHSKTNSDLMYPNQTQQIFVYMKWKR